MLESLAYAGLLSSICLELTEQISNYLVILVAVVLACRSVQRGEALQRSIVSDAAAAGQADPHVEVMELDLSSLASIRKFAKEWAATGRPLNILVNNAGIFAMSAPRCETPDGFEMHMGTNHLGHFLLTLLLMPSLRAGAAALGRPSRVVNVSSRLQLMGRLRRDDPNITTGYNSLAAYAQSKLAQVAFASELTRRGGGDVIAVAVHPGEVATGVVRSLPGPIQTLYNVVMGAILLTPAQGARSSVYCATSPDLDTPKQRGVIYYDSNCTPGASNPETKDPETCAWLWKWSAEAVKLAPKDDLKEP